MKKINLFITLLAILTLGACTLPNNNDDDPSNISDSSGLDENEYFKVNLIDDSGITYKFFKRSYKVGEEVKIITSAISDADVVVKVYSETVESYPVEKYDPDKPGYLGFKFIMPSEDVTIEISTITGGLLPETYTFEELFDFKNEITLENMVKVTIDHGPGSINSPWLHTIYKTQSKEYFKLLVDYMDTVRFIEYHDHYAGAGTYNVTIETTNSTYEINFSSREEFYVDGVTYLSSKEFPLFMYQDGCEHYFETLSKPIFKSYDEEIELDESYMSNIIFVEAIFEYGPMEYPEYDFTKDATIYLSDEYVLRILSKDLFLMNDVIYKVVSEANFSSLIKDINDKTSYIELVNGDHVYCRIKVSNNIIYSKDELYRFMDEIIIKNTNGNFDNITCNLYYYNEEFDWEKSNFEVLQEYEGQIIDEDIILILIITIHIYA